VRQGAIAFAAAVGVKGSAMSCEADPEAKSASRSRSKDSDTDYVRVNLLGQSPVFLHALERIRKLAASVATVLILGETGTGKELAARAIHYLGGRRHAPFIPVNCGAIPDNLVESEFFGHRRGAFTDARESRIGVIEQAEGGTLFLDELEALSARAQVVLLRFLQDHTYTQIGGSIGRRANIRVIGSSNADLQHMAARGQFRSDLLFRLSVLPLELPALRKRDGDAVLLARAFIQRFAAQYGRTSRPLDARSVAYLQQHDWPGNVRELENLIHRAFVLGDEPEISLDVAQDPAVDAAAAFGAHHFREAKANAIATFERDYLRRLLQKTGGNISMAARLCGKERSRLARLMKKHGLDRLAFAARA
jgi:DNA-binding NtrC family response regulator